MIPFNFQIFILFLLNLYQGDPALCLVGKYKLKIAHEQTFFEFRFKSSDLLSSESTGTPIPLLDPPVHYTAPSSPRRAVLSAPLSLTREDVEVDSMNFRRNFWQNHQYFSRSFSDLYRRWACENRVLNIRGQIIFMPQKCHNAAQKFGPPHPRGSPHLHLTTQIYSLKKKLYKPYKPYKYKTHKFNLQLF